MWKTLVASPLAGGVSAVLGWTGALLFQGSMSEADFASLRFGWTGAIVGGIAIASILILFVAGSGIEPIVMVGTAALVAFLLWDTRELPFETGTVQTGTSNAYWFAVAAMIAIYILLLLSLRSSRDSHHRARS